MIEISSDEGPPSSDSEDEYHEVRAAFQSITILSHLAKHGRASSSRALPFLVRNLRKGFLSACARNGVRTHPRSNPKRPVRILLRYPIHTFISQDERGSDDEDMEEHDGGELREWRCPVCDLLGEMSTRDMLVYHMSRDHDEVNTEWVEEVSVATHQCALCLRPFRAISGG